MFDQFFELSGNKLEYSKNFGYLWIDKKGKKWFYVTLVILRLFWKKKREPKRLQFGPTFWHVSNEIWKIFFVSAIMSIFSTIVKLQLQSLVPVIFPLFFFQWRLEMKAHKLEVFI